MSKRKKSSNKQVIQARSRFTIPSALPLSVLAGVAIIAAAAFFAYFPSINGGFIFDDDSLMANNRLIRASDGLYRIWCTTEPYDYWPLINSAFWIEWRLWGMNPTGYHVTNLVLHVVESLLIWIILRKLFIPGAFLAAAIFALHPVNVESVAWISQQKNTMSMLFFLLSILCYLRWEISSSLVKNGCYRGPSSFISHPSSLLWYWLSLAAFVLAMLSKGSVVVLPVLLLGIVWWLRGKKGTGSERSEAPAPVFFVLTRRDLARTAPFFLVGLVLTAVNIWFQTKDIGEAFRSANFAQRLLGAGGIVWFYLYKALLPFDLAFVYPQWHIEAGNPLWWIPLFAVLAVTVLLWWYRNGWSRSILFAWGFFCVALVPVMGFTDVFFMKYSLVADHYQHIAIIGVIALVSAGWSIWQNQLQGAGRRASAAVAIVALGALLFMTRQQNGIYHDSITLYQTTLKKNPDSWMLHYNLGVSLAKAGRLPEAIDHYRQALEIKPDLIDAYNNLGNVLARTGHLQEAISYLRQYLRIKPGDAEGHNNLGMALCDSGHPQEGIEQYEQALRLNQDMPEIHNNLGNALAKSGRPQEAIEHYRRVLALKPDYPDAHNNLGNALLQTGHIQESIEQYEQALRLKPDFFEAHCSLGLTLANQGRLPEAIQHYQQAARLRPENIETYFNLALMYVKLNRPAEAVAAAQKALELARSQGQTTQAKQIEDWLNSQDARP